MTRARLLLGACIVLTACGTSSVEPPPASTTALAGEIVASEIVVGDQRLPIGILDHNTPISDAVVRARAFLLAGSGSVPKGESDAPFKGEGLEGAGIYLASIKFDTAGDWGVELTVQRPNGEHAVIPLRFSVIATPVVPGVGQPAPRSQNQTLKDVPDVSYIDSSNPPDDMHSVSIADAIAQHRPTLVVFASPLLCTSRICGPEVHVVQSLEPAYRDRLTFIHVEPYQLKPQPSLQNLTKTTLEWRLQTEPWIFLIDSKGIVRARFEGPTATGDVKAAIDQLLAAP